MNADSPGVLAREPIGRWWLLWTLYGLPRCSQDVYPADYTVDSCHRLIWPWQPREVRNGAPVHVACLLAALAPDKETSDERR